MRYLVVVLTLCLFVDEAFPQQQVDPAVWQHVIQQVIQQRDAAMMANANAQIKIEQLTAELEKLKAHNEAAPDK